VQRRLSVMTVLAVIVGLCVTEAASASHTLSEDDPYYPIECFSGTKPPVQVRSHTPLFTGFASCTDGDESHYTYEVTRADGVEAKGIVTFDPEDGAPSYSALRPGHDQVIVTLSDGRSEGEATVNLEIMPVPEDFQLVDDQILGRNRIVSLGATGCAEFPFAVSSCLAKAKARATIRERGRPKRTITIGKASATLMPGQVKSLKVKLSKRFVRVLKQARQMKVTVVLKTQQTDPFGLWKEKIKDDFKLFP
jgi:hypothetical protein